MATRRRRRSVNQQRIAAELEVSQATVSRSLQNDPAINPETRALVLEAAARLGYLPSVSLRQERRRRTALLQIGVLVQDSPSGPGLTVTRLIAGITAAAQRLQVAVNIHHVPIERAATWHRPPDRPLMIEQGLVKGLLLLRQFDADAVAEVAAQMPCVSIVHGYSGASADLVASADLSHTEQWVLRLASLGHRRIAFVGQQPGTTWCQRRWLGFRIGLERAALASDPALVRLDWPEHSQAAVEQEILTDLLQRGCSGIVCAGDSVAQRVCRQLRAVGAEPGRDIAVTGHDGAPNPGGIDLATVRVPFEELGVTALQQLKERIGNPGMPKREILLHGVFHEGHSLCPPVGPPRPTERHRSHFSSG
jgi:DNA-binding LacI/PurR family transcriptional regulator